MDTQYAHCNKGMHFLNISQSSRVAASQTTWGKEEKSSNDELLRCRL